ncbi:MAG: dipicolinate synthase subunit B [Firmicutes bacterium]|nr:dipicolinate synthase subunit B [Bacillota bacterium]
MPLNGKNIGFALTGSHCTYEDIWPQVEALIALGANVYPFASETVVNTDTRFGKGTDIIAKFSEITGKPVVTEIVDAEPFGPKKLLDVVIIAPCTGNTMARLANAITDTAVLMIAKAHLRNLKPLVLAISTNDGLSMNAKNLGLLLNTRNVYFVPFGQDNPDQKRNSLVADMTLIIPTLEKALEFEQLQPIIIERSIRAVK